MLASVIGSASDIYCQSESKSKDRITQQALTFKPIVHSRGFTKDGEPTASHVYESSDGVKIIRTGEVYLSPERAHEKLEKNLESAIRIIERQSKIEKGRRGGERVVAVFADEAGDEKILILRTYGKVFSSIAAPTLRHALAFERFATK